MSLCYQAGPHNYSMSLPGWFSHCLKLLSLRGGIEKDQRRGSDVNPLFEAHLCSHLCCCPLAGEGLALCFQCRMPQASSFKRQHKIRSFFSFCFVLLFFLSPSMKQIYFSFGSHCAPRAERMHLMRGWSSAAEEGILGGTRGSCLPLHWRGSSAPVWSNRLQPQVMMGANGCPRMWHSAPPLYNMAIVGAFCTILGAPQ